MHLVAFSLVGWNNADVVETQLLKEHGKNKSVHFAGKSKDFEDILKKHVNGEIEDGASPKEPSSRTRSIFIFLFLQLDKNNTKDEFE